MDRVSISRKDNGRRKIRWPAGKLREINQVPSSGMKKNTDKGNT
ncbi:hypothetical protein HMPREF0972_00107 [Actinomyces sp. oral taxon 848 str. F0332]|nr:hypothetical protein HMPREF0972_00107 [Actinomyces sp. oral taxon 848 str. F0332]